jgi:TPR repeat protein
MRCILILLIFCAGCSRPPGNPVKDARQEDNDSLVPIAELRKSAEEGRAAAQRELAGRLLFGQGVAADPAEAVVWARKAALNGDETASLWTGRAALEKPHGRIEASAWFLIGKAGGNAAIRQDAEGEIEALKLTNEELTMAAKRAEELKKTILKNSK